MRAGRQDTASTGLVPPSRFVRIVMRPMTRPLNPLIGKLAGRRHFGLDERAGDWQLQLATQNAEAPAQGGRFRLPMRC